MKPCKHGHALLGRGKDGKCIECRRNRANARYAQKRLEAGKKSRYEEDPRRIEAMARRDKFYLPGFPCRNGHISERRTSTDCCQACDRAWNAANPDTMAASRAKWRTNNPEKSRSCTAAWAATHPEKKREKDRKWHVANKEYNNARARKWQRENYERTAERRAQWKWDNWEKVNTYSRNRRAMARKADGQHTGEDVAEIRKLQRGKCAYCRVSLSRSITHVDHIAPLSLGGSNAPSNLQILCEPCNLSKGRKHPVEYAQRIGRLI